MPGQRRKPIIGLSGGIGSGKSTVAAVLAELGAGVIDADRIGHEELHTAEVAAELAGWWGPGVLDAEGRADRDAVRQRVRGDDVARRRLEGLLHPRIRRRSEALLEQYQRDDAVRAVVWDAPLLFEVGLDRRCDAIWFVEADPAVRLARVQARGRSWTAEDLADFEARQLPLDFKKGRADLIIENNSDAEALGRQTREALSRILSGFSEPQRDEISPSPLGPGTTSRFRGPMAQGGGSENP